MELNLDLIKKRVEEGYISVQKHPEADLFIYNYTPAASYGRVWDAATLNCRGLILDGEGNVVARPFVVMDKMDGSLGIMYPGPANVPAIATRGSFTSDQAIHATGVLWTKYADWVEEIKYTYWESTNTFLFEIIYPSNRIVVNYKDTDDLILLAIIGNKTGTDAVDVSEIDETIWPGPKVRQFTIET
jgi:RNA ligase